MTRPLVAWPGRQLGGTLPFCGAFALSFAVLYGGASWWTARLASLPDWNLPFEAYVPFVPWLCLVYMTITPVLCLAPFVFRTPGELAPLFATLTVELVIGTACFLLMPQTVAWVRPPVHGWIALPFSVADAMNLSFNQFPSLHVAFAVTAALAYSRGRSRLARTAWLSWSAAVALSAWLMWEHNLADIAGGVVLAVAAMLLVYRKIEDERVRESIWIELTCVGQCMRFARRHVRYLVIFFVIWGASLRRWREYRVVRTGFCVAQWIDDLLDGDRKADREPLLIVDELLQQIETGEPGSEPLPRLTRAFLEDLRGRGVERVAEFTALVREMRRDRVRALERSVWDRAMLDEHHRITFTLSVNLMLATSGCTARAEEVPDLIHALAWCSVFRDLDDDLRAGIINIPQDVLTDCDPGALQSSPAFLAWREVSAHKAGRAIANAEGQIEALADGGARRVLGIFQRSIAKSARGSNEQ